MLMISMTFVHSQISFNEQSSQSGVDNESGYIILGGGISFVDFDDDGWDDITVPSADGYPLRFYKNFSGNFLEVYPIIPIITYQTKSVTWVDIDNDGDKDLYITSDDVGNKLYKNNGNFTFQDVTATCGLPQGNLFTYGASWGEIDNDGYLDVFISNRIVTGGSISNYLYRNNGDGTFTDVTAASGITIAYELSFCSGFFDYDNDGWQDIYIANDKSFPNVLYKNNGDGTYTDVSLSSGTGIAIDAMSVTVDDFNADGFFDIYVTNTYFPISDPGGNVLFKNNGDGTFTDIAASSGTIFDSVGWGAVFLDADNDADLDLYVSGSLDGSVSGLLSSAFYENIGPETFTMPLNSGLDLDQQISYANAIGDLDNDGKLDIVVYNNDYRPSVYKNTSTNTNNYLGIELVGTTSNKDGIGSVIEISINGEQQYRYTMCGEGYMSQNTHKEYFGLGTETEVDYVKVKWLSGIEDTIFNVSANQVLTVIEGSTLSVDDNVFNSVKITPNPFDDYISIQKDNTFTYQIEIENILGERIFSGEVDHTNSIINIGNISSGVYFLVLKYEDSFQKVHKLIKK